jgi:phosphatidylglycerol:prolipoprotein diacylglycerol transferase
MNIEFFPESNIILTIGTISIYFYGFMYLLSVIFSYFLISFWVNKRNILLSKDSILDLIFYTFLGGVLGGRIFYVIFYNLSFFIDNPLEILFVWNGGMSIHGGLFGGAICFYIFCRYKNINWKSMADITVPSIAFGMALGRLGNFMNGELVGRETDLFWGMDFGDGENRHPAQIYAMIKDLFLFILFSYILWKGYLQDKWGSIIALFLVFYATLRFLVEFVREPDSQLGFIYSFLTMGQIFSITLFLIGISLYFFARK